MPDALKVHVALNAPAFADSVAFYRAFFGLEPVKLKPGYAKFDVAEPPLNLTLNEAPARDAGALSHLGIQVDSTESVARAAARLREAGLATWEEKDTDCCYALQDKVWVTDPNGYRWEVFVVKVGDTRPDVRAEAGRRGLPCLDQPCCAP
jgi:catechol 2,3-dioxygenase-like lactoylglutathione lyase family enzyme